MSHERTLHGMVGAGIVDVACRVGEGLGLSRSELLYVAALEAEDLRDPGARVPAESLLELVQYILERGGDRSFGIRFAEAMDLRTQGFWGYLFISCLTLRQAAELLVRFQHLRHASRMTYRVEGDWAIFERREDPALPKEFEVVVGDAFLASFCFNRRRWAPEARGEMQAWLMYPEEPHHRELRALVAGPVTFNAPFYRHCIPAWELDLPLRGADPHLLSLAEAQLQQQVVQATAPGRVQDAAELVRNLLLAQLHEGVSIERVARELHLSVRTLRRRLDALGVTFQRLLEEVRHRRAVEYLTKTEEAIESVAERLGYVDPSNFRRAFRRWTGLPPTAYRAAHAARPHAQTRPPRSLP
jgi:AraC-like DNA-binding protein